jgi:DNA-nicking Smr family endonuclease
VGLLGAIPAATLDLHGLRAGAAERRVTDFLTTQARVNRGGVVHVITGSGLGSPGGPVLRGRVGELLDGRLARFVAEHRLDLHRGGWLVRLP